MSRKSEKLDKRYRIAKAKEAEAKADRKRRMERREARTAEAELGIPSDAQFTSDVKPTPLAIWAKRFPYTPPPAVKHGPSQAYSPSRRRGKNRGTRGTQAARAEVAEALAKAEKK